MRDLRALGSGVRVRLVQHEGNGSVIRTFKPGSRGFEYRALNGTDEHVLQHGVVRDEDVRWRCLHVPPAEHLWSLNGRPVAGASQLLGEALPFLRQLVHIVIELLALGALFRPPGWRRQAGVHSEVNQVPVEMPLLPVR